MVAVKNVIFLQFFILAFITISSTEASEISHFKQLHEGHYCEADTECALQPMAISEDTLKDTAYNQVINLKLIDSTMDDRGFAWIMWDAYEPSKGIAHFSQEINKTDAYLEYRNPLDYEDTVPNVNDWLFDAYLNRPDNPSAINKFAVFNRNKTVVLPLWKQYVDKPAEHLKGMSAVYNKVNCFFGFDNCEERRIYQISGYAAFDVVGKQKVKVGKEWQYTIELRYKGLRHCFNREPTAEDQNLVTTEDTPLNISINATDPDDDDLLFNIVTSTQNGKIVPNNDGTFIYTPHENFHGNDQFLVSITDGLKTIENTIHIEVTPVNDAPQAKPQTLQILEDTNQEILLYGSDVDGDNLNFDIQNQPIHGTLEISNNKIFYTPNANFAGKDSFTYIVDDGELTDTAIITIDVLPVNDAPIAEPGSYEILEDNILELSLKGSDIDGDTLKFGITQTTQNGKLIILGNRITYVPNQNFHGQDQFEFIVSDGELNDTATINITVKPVNDSPEALPQTTTTDEDVAIDIILEGTDVDSNALDYSIQTQPTNGTVILVNNVATYTPNLDFNGDDQFIFKVSDGELNATAVVKVVVRPVDDDPIYEAMDYSKTTFKDTPLDIDVIGGNSSIDPDKNYEIKIVDNSTQGNAKVIDGIIQYIPNEGYLGKDRLTYQLISSDGISNTATINIGVVEVSNEGREFWLTFLPNYSKADALSLFVSSQTDAEVSIEIPLLNVEKKVTVSANSVTTVDLTEYYSELNVASKSTSKFGIYVSSEQLVSVYALNQLQHTTDAASIIPLQSLGSQYLHASYKESANSRDETLSVVATQDGTKIDITERSGGITQSTPPIKSESSITLKRGEVYYLSGSQLGGTSIISSAPVAVFSGNICTSIANGSACDHIYEQIASIDVWSKDIVTSPLASRKNGDTFRVYASTDNTKIYINQKYVTTLQTGGIYQAILTGGNRIQASQPIWVNQFSNSSGYDGVPSDPFMMGLASTANYLKSYTITTPLSGFGKHFVNIISPTDSISSFTLDGAPLTNEWQPIEGTQYQYTQVAVVAGIHTITANQPFGLSSYGFGSYDSYGYNGGFNFANKIPEADFVLQTDEDIQLPIVNLPTDAKITKMPMKGSLDNTKSGVIYTPNANFYGIDEIIYEYVNTSGKQAIGVILIDILPVDDAPTKETIATTTKEDTAINLVFNNLDLDDEKLSFTISDKGKAKSLTFLKSENGKETFKYVPADNYFGNDKVIFEIRDGQSTAQAIADITITPVNDAPTVTPFTVKTLGDAINFDISQDADSNARGNDIEDGSNLTYHLGSVQNGAATQNGNTVTFIPQAGFDGIAKVYYYAKDTEGLNGSAQAISINVERINDTPMAKPLSYTINEDTIANVKFVATDEELASLTYSIVRQPSHGILEGDGENWVYQPHPNYHGTDTFVYGASDGNSIGTAEVTVVVKSVNDAPTTENQTFTIDEDTPISITLKGEDADGDELVYQMTNLGSKGVLTGSLPQFIYTPKADIVGTDRLSYRIFDGTTYAYGTINITINPINDAPVPRDVSQTVSEDGTTTFYLSASDPEGNAISYALKTQPKHGIAEMISNNRVRYTPKANYFGEDNFEFTASDGELDGTGRITMTVSPTADRPVASESTEIVAKNRTSTLALMADDVDGDTLTYTIVTAPTHGTINENGALPSYTPEPDFEGKDSFVFRVSDGTYTDDATVSLTVTTLPSKPPVWQSVAPTEVEATQTYAYTLLAYDPDSTAITYALDGDIPEGMTLIGNALTWTPTINQVGSHEVRLIANDAESSNTVQIITIEVLEISVAPDITSQPIMQTYAGKVYRHEVVATDANTADVLTYRLSNAPKGMTIDAKMGEIIWQAPPEGVYKDIKIEVSDGRWMASQTYTLTVLKAVPLKVTLDAPDAIDVDTEFTVTVNLAGGGSDAVIELTNDNALITVDAFGKATLKSNTLGQHILRVKVTDGNEVSMATHYYIVKDASDTTAPTITFTDTADPLFITKPTDIIGSISDDTAVVWEVVLYDSYDALTGTGSIVWQNSGTGSVNGEIATINPTLMVNGAYTLITKVTDAGGNTTQNAKNIVIDGNMKLGELAFTLQDAQITMPSLDVSVERSYDSRTAYKSGDFGHGWNLGLQTIKMRESRPMHTGWQAYLKRQLIPNVGTICLKPINQMKEPVITVTLPNGDVETFKPQIGCNQGIYYDDQDLIAGGNSFSLSFEATGDTQSKFEVVDHSSLSYGDGRWTTGDRIIDENGNYDYPYLIPKRFKLTTLDGMQYEFSRSQFGGVIRLDKLTDPAGHTLTISETGITHSLGPQARFIRDASNRITRVTLPDNRYWQYMYDSRGDLVKVTDPANVQNLYVYDDNHRLLEITDKNGVLLTGYEYDDTGRLVAMLDAKGNRIAIEHQLDSNSQIITDARGFKTTYTYDDYGNVTKEADALGNIITRAYDTNYNKLSETDANGNTTIWTYDDKHNKLSETNALGQTATYVYDSRGQLLSETDHTGQVTSVNTYDSSGQLSSLKDVVGNTTAMGYDVTGLTSITDAMGNTTAYTYTGDDLTQVTDPVGTSRSYTYDANNRKIREVVNYTRYDSNKVNYTNSWSYDTKGRVVNETIAGLTTYKTYGDSDEVLTSRTGNDTTTYVYDANKQLTQTIYPDGSSQFSTYDAAGNVVTEKDAMGNITTHDYDALNRKFKTTLPNGGVITTRYDGVGNVISETDASGNTSTHEYDALGRKIVMTDSMGNIHRYIYNELGRLSQETDKLGRTTQYIYNVLGQRTNVIYADGSSTQTSYDVLGRKLTETNELGQTTQYSYDVSGRLIAVTDAMGNITAYTYDSLGNKTSQTDALGRVTKWTYDTYSRQYQHILPDGSYSIKGYDGKGRTTYVDDFNRKRQAYLYDVQDRIVQTSYSDGSSDIIDYNALGQRIKTTRSEAGSVQTTRYVYDNMGNLTQETKPSGEVLNYAYNNSGNKTVMTLVSNGNSTSTQYGYDSLNRLISTTDSTGITTYRYNAVGNKIGETKPNAIATQYRFNAKNQLTSMEHSKDNQVIARYAYMLDPMGKRTKLTEETLSDTPTTTTSVWQYDDLNRLISETVNGQITTHDYDAVSNRIKQTKEGQVTTYRYDNNDRLTQETGARTASYTYDKQGNTLAQNVNGQMTSYSYNVRNELVQTDDVNFGYDIDGIRNSKAKNGVTVDYITDKNRDYAQVILEKQNNTPVASYSYGDDLISQNVNGTTSYFGYDGLGSTKFLTNQAGQITDSYQYDAYGEITDKTGNTDNIYLYTGEQFDRSLNQYYLRARYYNQGVGRFTQMDSWQGKASNPTTLNKYLYANGAPILYTDPSGHFGLASFSVGSRVQGVLSSIALPSYAAVGSRILSTLIRPIVISANARAVAPPVLASLAHAVIYNMCINNESCKPPVPILFYGANHGELTQHIADA